MLRALFATALILVPGCGGGSSGTGTGSSVTITGSVRSETDAPLPGVTVTIIETGDSDITDSAGIFEIETEPVAPALTLEFEANNRTATTTITTPGENGTLSITVKINPLFDQIDVTNLLVDARIVGQCDPYFENRKVIRQSVATPPQIECTAKVTVIGDGIPLAHVPIAIQYRRCAKSAPWNTTALGQTMTGGNLGIGQVQFNFVDDREHCLYRIVAPFQQSNLAQIVKEIQTFTFQNRK